MATALESLLPQVDERRSLADLLHDLGDIPPERVRLYPPPGTVGFEQFVAINERVKPICEWVDNTLVEKAVGFRESCLAMWIGAEITLYLKQHDVGILSGPDGVMRILPTIGRAPDVAVILRSRFAEGKLPTAAVPELVPDLAIEVLSSSNTVAEMKRKRCEYFQAGTQVVWEIDAAARTAWVYRSDDEGVCIGGDGVLTGEPVLPGFRLSLRELFSHAEQAMP
jgi:Uma2 family endonuclease